MINQISVVVPVYNTNQKSLLQCVNSLLNQKSKYLEIILSDDGSDDDTRNFCDELANKNSVIRVLHLPHKGVSNARNEGVRASGGKYIQFVDADDAVDEECVLWFNHAIELFGDVELIICNYKRCSRGVLEPEVAEGTEPIIRMLSNEELLLIQKGALLEVKNAELRVNGAPWAKLYKKSLIQDSGVQFDLELIRSQDNEFNFRIFQKVHSAAYISKALYYYIYNSSSAVNRYNPRAKEYATRYLTKIKIDIKEAGLENDYRPIFDKICIQKFKELCDSCYANPASPYSRIEAINLIKLLSDDDIFHNSITNIDCHKGALLYRIENQFISKANWGLLWMYYRAKHFVRRLR